MDLAQLEVFLMVAREGRFSRAAEKLYRTQSAVSQSIRKLEEEVGEALFDRSSRDGLLTDAGHVLQEYAERLLNLRNNAREALMLGSRIALMDMHNRHITDLLKFDLNLAEEKDALGKLTEKIQEVIKNISSKLFY